MKNIFKVALIIGLTMAVGSCEKVNDQNTAVNLISYGTSFGECLNYCVRSITIQDSEISYVGSGWDLDGKLPDVNLSEEINIDDWNSLVELIDFKAFQELDSIIGCPDCADGGAEWIEIKQNNKSYKVLFEYNNEPETVSAYIGILRNYLSDFNDNSGE